MIPVETTIMVFDLPSDLKAFVIPELESTVVQDLGHNTYCDKVSETV